MTDINKVIQIAEGYIGKNGRFVCIEKLNLGYITHWCAYAVTCIFRDAGFLGKYVKEIEGGAGSIPRGSDGKYGRWFTKWEDTPRAGDLIFFRYANYPKQDKYFCDHVGIVKNYNRQYELITTLEGNVQATDGNRWAETSTFKECARYRYNSDVYAFYRPNYVEEKQSVYSVGDKVKVIKAIQYDNGKPFYADSEPYNVIEVVRDRVVIKRGGFVIAAVAAENLAPYSDEGRKKVKIQKGDTLSGIADRYGLSLERILRLNRQIKNPDLIYAGDYVYIS